MMLEESHSISENYRSVNTSHLEMSAVKEVIEDRINESSRFVSDKDKSFDGNQDKIEIDSNRNSVKITVQRDSAENME